MNAEQQRIAKEIGTLRFTLRPLASTDETLYRNLYCDSATMRFVDAPLSEKRASTSFRSALKHSSEPNPKEQFLVVVCKATERQLGICGIRHGVPRLGSSEIGMMLIADARGQGYSHEVLAGVANFAFLSSHVEQVWVRYLANHFAAYRLVKGLGFTIGMSLANADGDSQSWREAYMCRDAWHVFHSIESQGVTLCLQE
jgi:RimJ/RimL family protein N-acetyltransferase